MNSSAKLHHKMLRPALVDSLQSQATSLQQGCGKGSFGLVLRHFVATTAKTAKARKRSWGVYFLDLSAAYYRLVRETLFGAENDAGVVDILRRVNVPASFLDEIRAVVSGTCLLKDASPLVRRMVRAISAGTYFVMDAVPGLTMTSAGSRPGDAIADVLFAIAAADLIREVNDRFSREFDLVPDTPGWADDLCWPLNADDARDLLSRMACLTGMVHTACHRRAMCPNYKGRKSEVMLGFHEKGSREAKQLVFGRGTTDHPADKAWQGGQHWLCTEIQASGQCDNVQCKMPAGLPRQDSSCVRSGAAARQACLLPK